ncbi:MAG: Fis family transcriptional regulator [Thermoprotei archaeon]|nr:MAG: Fis family transcriptional regulator [Thermoprotei archaeon]
MSFKEEIIRLSQIFKALITRKKLALCDKGDFDGIASAALFKRKFKEGVVVLASPYEVRTNPLIRAVKWYYVADLPCPGRAFMRVDHHETNVPCAELEFHDPRAPASALLALKALNLEDDSLAVEIVKLAVETDTANVSSREALFLDSAVKGSDYLGKIYLVEKLSEIGVKILEDERVKKWIEIHTKKLKFTKEIVNKLKMRDVMILIFEKDIGLDYRYMCILLERKGAKMSLIVVPKKFFKVRLYAGARPESGFDAAIVAKMLGGGGHRYAAGATFRSFTKKGIDKAISTFKRYLAQERIKVFIINGNKEIRETHV